MIGILVHGSNHFIVEGPLPDLDAARKLIRVWEIPSLGSAPAIPWRVISRAFRENLEWAVVLDADSAVQENVAGLVEEVRSRGVAIHRGPGPLLALDGHAGWTGAHWPVLL